MARALVITHSRTEHVGVFAAWLAAAGLELDLCQPWDGDPVPAALVDHDALLVMGGPQQAYDEASAPWLAATKALLRLAVEQQVPTLGEHVFDFFLRNKRAEWKAYRQEVTPFELGRYLPVL